MLNRIAGKAAEKLTSEVDRPRKALLPSEAVSSALEPENHQYPSRTFAVPSCTLTPVRVLASRPVENAAPRNGHPANE